MTEQIRINFEQKLTFEEEKVWDIVKLYHGKENAIKGSKIAEWTGLEYDYVRSVIRHLRNGHKFNIASCGRGYYMPQTIEELFEATKSLRHRGLMVFLTAKNIMKSDQSLEEIFQQTKLEFNGGEAA